MPYFSSPDVAKNVPYDDPVAAMTGGFGIKMGALLRDLVPEQRIDTDTDNEVDDRMPALQEALMLIRPVHKNDELVLPPMDAETQNRNGYNYALYLMRLAMQGMPILRDGSENPSAVRTAEMFRTHRDALIAADLLPDYDHEFTPAELDGSAIPDNVTPIRQDIAA